MTAPFNDEEIVALYKESATQTPSDALDNRILGYAEEHIQAKVQTHKRPPWWTYAGVAATVGFVALLAPWTWVDQSLHSPAQRELMQAPMPAFDSPKTEHLEMEAAADAVAEEQTLMLAEPNEARQSSKMLQVPQQKLGNLMKATINPFETVEALLENGEKQKAIALLKQQLEEQPELANDLPENLRRLLEEESNESTK